MTTLLNETLRQESIYIPTPARIATINAMTATEKLFRVALPSGFSLAHRPGQFVEVSIFGVGEAPISICSSPSHSNGSFELCVRSAGKLTNALHRLSPGGTIAIRGPFGRGFPIERFRGKDIIFVAGGLGIAPLRSLIEEVIADRGKYGRVYILYGSRSPNDILFSEDLKLWANAPRTEVHLTVDRTAPGWDGNIGVITTLFPKLRFHSRNMVAVVVGPPVMYRFVLMELLARGLADGNIWLSFERQMKCAVGKCGHCQMHHIYTCQDGPAFSYAQIKNLEEAL